MARKRGGLAGLYDRNKGVIQAAAPFLAGAVGGPLAGAAIGAAMKGFDRPGKGGIGFDLSEGLKGGISGYGAGSIAQSAKNALQGRLASLFTGGARDLAPFNPADKIGITPSVVSGANAPLSVAPASTGGLSATATPKVFSDAMKKGATRGKSLMNRAASFAEKNPNVVAGIAKGAMGDPAAELEMQKYRDEQERLQRRAGIAAGMFTGGAGAGAFGATGDALNNKYGSLNTYLYNTAPGAEAFGANGAEREALGRAMMEDQGQPFGMQRPAALPRRGRSAGMFGPGMAR